jgi:hypothetical protein
MKCQSLTEGVFVAIAGLGAMFAVQPVLAGGCYPSLAATVVRQVLDGGGTSEQAIQAAYADGSYDGSETCLLRIKGVLKRGY